MEYRVAEAAGSSRLGARPLAGGCEGSSFSAVLVRQLQNPLLPVETHRPVSGDHSLCRENVLLCCCSGCGCVPRCRVAGRWPAACRRRAGFGSRMPERALPGPGCRSQHLCSLSSVQLHFAYKPCSPVPAPGGPPKAAIHPQLHPLSVPPPDCSSRYSSSRR